MSSFCIQEHKTDRKTKNTEQFGFSTFLFFMRKKKKIFGIFLLQAHWAPSKLEISIITVKGYFTRAIHACKTVLDTVNSPE